LVSFCFCWVARFEAQDFGRILVAAYVGTAVISVGVVTAAHWLLHFSIPVLLLIGVCATIISVGMVVREAAHRHYIQCAFIEMTLSHLEGELSACTICLMASRTMLKLRRLNLDDSADRPTHPSCFKMFCVPGC
jgi:hypothetical protein